METILSPTQFKVTNHYKAQSRIRTYASFRNRICSPTQSTPLPFVHIKVRCLSFRLRVHNTLGEIRTLNIRFVAAQFIHQLTRVFFFKKIIIAIMCPLGFEPKPSALKVLCDTISPRALNLYYIPYFPRGQLRKTMFSY